MSSKSEELSTFLRARIVTLHDEGKTLREIGKIVKRPFSTVRYIINKYKITGSVENLPRSGRPKILNDREERAILKEVQKDPKISAQTLASNIAEAKGKSVCAETVRKVIRNAGYNGRVARRKPFISEQNRVKRLEFASEYLKKPVEFWKSVLFSDESKFNLFSSDGRRMVWRKPNTELETKHLIPTVKHGGGNVLVWGCMSYKGVGNLHFIDNIMDAKAYVKILQSNLTDSVEKMGMNNGFIFQQDNDPKHTARIVKEWLLYNVQKTLPHPPQSPDLNPIENLWHILDLKIRKYHISNKEELKSRLREEWAKISFEITSKLVTSMPERLQAVLDAKGMHTKY